jgi:hypothetical protein
MGGSVGASQPTSPPVKIHLALQRDEVVAGQTIKGTVVLTNTTSRRFTVKACAKDGWLQVGLKGHGYSYGATSLLIACPPSIRLAPGPNHFSVSVLTSYQSCVQPGGQLLTPIHQCTPGGGLPALPAGKYSTTAFIFGLQGLTQTPKSVTVTLLPAAQ